MSSRGRQGDFIVESRILSVLESGIEPIPAKVASVLKQRFRTLFDRKPDAMFLKTVTRILSRLRAEGSVPDKDDEDVPGEVDADGMLRGGMLRAAHRLANGSSGADAAAGALPRSDSRSSLNQTLYGSSATASSSSPTPLAGVSGSSSDALAATGPAGTVARPGKRQRPGGRRQGGARASRRDAVVVKRGKDVEGVDGAADGPPQFDGRPTARYDDLGGVDEALRAVRELVEYPLTHPEIYEHLGVDPPRGILLHGPPGCGKTLLANAIAGELGETVSFHKVGATELVSSQSGASEKRIRDLFDDAAAQAPALIFIDEIDAIAAKRDNAGSTMERRMVAQLLTSLDGLTLAATGGEAVIVLAATNRPDALDNALRRSGRFDREIVMPIPDEAARERILRKLTERMALAESIDLAAIARNTPGYVGADLEALTREAAVCSVHRVFSDLFVRPDISIAAAEPAEKPKPSSSPSSSAAAQDDDDDDDDDDFDLAEPSPAAASSSAATPDASSSATAPTTVQSNSSARLDREAAAAAEMSDFATVSKRLRGVGRLTSEHLDRLAVSEADFEVALTKVQPTATREGFATVPNVTWADVGSLDEVREELRLAIVEPIRRPEVYEDLGLSIPAGVLLFGPPGCGKTLLAKAIANQSQANFISVKGPELLDKYVGESERAVRQVFTRARASAPCIIFFDELDALAPRRGSGGGGGGVSERVVNQLLTELDGLEARRDVYVVAATNRPDMIDPAMLRPGRLDKLLFVPLPDADGRASIIKTHTRKTPIGPGVDVSKVARDARCDRFSGADLAGLVREAALSALRERLASEEGPEAAAGSSPRSSAHVHVVVQASHFERALSRVRPSVSRADQKLYNSMERRLRNARATVAKEGAAGAADEGAGVPAAAPVDDGKRGVTMKR